MRKSKIIKIDGVGEVTVKEVSPYAVYQALSADDKKAEILSVAMDCTTLPLEKIQQLYPSEIEQLVDTFMEVNSSFLAVAGKLGLKDTMTNIVDEISKTLPQLFVASYRQVMARMPGITDGAAS